MTIQNPSRPPGNPAASATPAPAGGKTSDVAGLKLPPIDQLKGRPLGRVLIKMGVLTRELVHKALAVQQEQRAKGVRIPVGQILIDMGLISEKIRNIALASQMGYEYVDLEGKDISPEAVATITSQTATSYRIMPLEWNPETKTLKVALASPDDFQAVDDLRSLMGFNVQPVVADADQIEKLIKTHYTSGGESLADLLGELEGDAALLALQKTSGDQVDLDTLKQLAESNPVKRLLNMILLQSIKDHASDVHFEPFEEEFKLRYRIDGVLYEMIPPPKHIAMALVSRIKVMSNLDIAERRMPQDGRIPLVVEGKSVDLRVSVLPTIYGESVVMRILDRSNVQLDLEKIGMRDDDLRVFRQLINKPNGIVLVTGPTGSGKTTTLYAALNELNSIQDKLITTEDPVEYDIDGITQVQIRAEIDLTFAKCLRSILRQDPDIVLVGEIRDKETAEISIQASLTGHLVFSTLHTNDAPASIARLLDLGIEPFLITATLEGILAQRLARRICVHCKHTFTPTEDQLMELELLPDDVRDRKFQRGRGCEACNNTGYRGRIGLYEIMTIDDELRDLITSHASTNLLRNAARKRGMRTLRETGLLAIFEGISTIEEVVRCTIVDD